MDCFVDFSLVSVVTRFTAYEVICVALQHLLFTLKGTVGTQGQSETSTVLLCGSKPWMYLLESVISKVCLLCGFEDCTFQELNVSY